MKTLAIATVIMIVTTIRVTSKINQIKKDLDNLRINANKIDLVKFELIDLQQKVSKTNILLKRLSSDIDKNTEKLSNKVEKEATRIIVTPLSIQLPGKRGIKNEN